MFDKEDLYLIINELTLSILDKCLTQTLQLAYFNFTNNQKCLVFFNLSDRFSRGSDLLKFKLKDKGIPWWLSG